MYQPGEIVEASDRTYITDRNGSLRVLEYRKFLEITPAPESVDSISGLPVNESNERVDNA